MSKGIRDGRGKVFSRFSWRLGEVEASGDDFVARIYYNEAKSKEDLDKPANKVFAVIRGETEERCYARVDHVFRQCCQGDFDDY